MRKGYKASPPIFFDAMNLIPNKGRFIEGKGGERMGLGDLVEGCWA
jgi:hypothetical protein